MRIAWRCNVCAERLDTAIDDGYGNSLAIGQPDIREMK
jgi:hypothetical protein